MLYSRNEQIRYASAIALGYLTFNRTASRLLLHNCRNVTHLYDTLIFTLRNNRISKQFIESYHTAFVQGLPKLLVKRKCSFFDCSNAVNGQFKGSIGENKLNNGEKIFNNVSKFIYNNNLDVRYDSSFKHDKNDLRRISNRAKSAPAIKRDLQVPKLYKNQKIDGLEMNAVFTTSKIINKK